MHFQALESLAYGIVDISCLANKISPSRCTDNCHCRCQKREWQITTFIKCCKGIRMLHLADNALQYSIMAVLSSIIEVRSILSQSLTMGSVHPSPLSRPRPRQLPAQDYLPRCHVSRNLTRSSTINLASYFSPACCRCVAQSPNLDLPPNCRYNGCHNNNRDV